MPKLIWNTDRGLEDDQTESLKVVEFRLCTNKSAFRNRRHNEWGRSDWYRDEYEVGEMEEKNGNRSNLRGMGNISNLFKTQTTLHQVLLTHPGYISRKCLGNLLGIRRPEVLPRGTTCHPLFGPYPDPVAPMHERLRPGGTYRCSHLIWNGSTVWVFSVFARTSRRNQIKNLWTILLNLTEWHNMTTWLPFHNFSPIFCTSPNTTETNKHSTYNHMNVLYI